MSVTIQAAMAAETVEADLAKAIALYERAVKEAGVDRTLAANPLLLLAQAQARAGRDADARATYERIIREYPAASEPETTARARLAAMSKPSAGTGASFTQRVAWTIPYAASVNGPVSEDGRFVPFHAPFGTPFQRHCFLHDLATGRIRPRAAAVVQAGDDRLMGWRPDRSAILFTHDRPSPSSLWSRKIPDGMPHGSAVLVRRDVGPLVPLGVTSSGALVASVMGGLQSEIEVGAFDLSDGHLIAPPADIVQRYPGAMAHPVWSPDGSALAFVVRNPDRRAGTFSRFIRWTLARRESCDRTRATTSASSAGQRTAVRCSSSRRLGERCTASMSRPGSLP